MDRAGKAGFATTKNAEVSSVSLLERPGKKQMEKSQLTSPNQQSKTNIQQVTDVAVGIGRLILVPSIIRVPRGDIVLVSPLDNWLADLRSMYLAPLSLSTFQGVEAIA